MNKRKINLIILGLIAVLSFSLIGCGKEEVSVERGHHDSKDKDDDKKDKDNDKKKENPYLISEDGPDVCDGMSIYGWDAMEFYVMKVGESYIEFPSGNDYIYLDYYCPDDYPDIKDGEIAKVVADVHLYDGGECGYNDTIFITDLISYEILDYDELDTISDIKEAGSTDYVYYLDFYKYEYDDTVYVIATYCGEIRVYADGVNIFNYDYYDSEEDFTKFFDYIYGNIDDSGIYVPNFTEDEILNMSDEQLATIGKYVRTQSVEDASTPNPLRTDYGLSFDDGYYYVGKYAYESASDEDMAMDIAMNQWYTRESTVGYYDNFTLLDYNGQFWLFSADFYYNDEYNFTDTMIVYDKSYYDVTTYYGDETNTAKFELNEENLREFFSYQNMDELLSSEFCIGEYLYEEDDTWVFRKYYVWVCYGDYGMSDEVNLYYDEWTVDAEGNVEHTIINDGTLKTVEIY